MQRVYYFSQVSLHYVHYEYLSKHSQDYRIEEALFQIRNLIILKFHTVQVLSEIQCNIVVIKLNILYEDF